VEVPQNFVPRTLVLPLQELVLAAEGEVTAVYSDVAVPVAGSRVGVQPLLVSEIRRPSVPDAHRMILRALAQVAVDPRRVLHRRSRSLPGRQFRRPSVAFTYLLPLCRVVAAKNTATAFRSLS